MKLYYCIQFYENNKFIREYITCDIEVFISTYLKVKVKDKRIKCKYTDENRYNNSQIFQGMKTKTYD